jgi:hypothetical protein
VRALVLVAVVACTKQEPPPRKKIVENVVVPPDPDAPCTVRLARTSKQIQIDRTVLADFKLATLRRALGEPDRVEHAQTRGRYEEFADGNGEGRSSEEYTSTDHYYVYDARGLVFHTTNGFRETATDPDTLLVFFPSPRVFDHKAAPKAVPKQRGACRVLLDKDALDPAIDLRPPALDPIDGHFTLGGMTFAVTSYRSVVDSLYNVDDDGPNITIYLDAPATGRVSYVEIK